MMFMKCLVNTYQYVPFFNIRKTCFQNKSKFNTEDHIVQHMNITINKA